MKFEPKIHQNIGFYKLQMECVKTKKSHLNRWLASSYKNVRFRAVQGVTFRCNMWMLLIVKLLSFKRYNYPFYKCRENEQQM